MAFEYDEWASTPGRSTSIEFNIPEVILGRSTYTVLRSADQIKPAEQDGFPASGEVRRFAGFAWSMKPKLTDSSNALLTGSGGGFSLLGALLDIGGFNVPFGENTVVQHLAWKTPADLPGVSTPDTLRSRGMPVWRRVVPAGESWNRELDTDLVVVPKPTLPSQHVAMDRLMVGRQTFPANQGFLLGIYNPPLVGSVNDTIMTFYFGGATDVSPGPSQNAGYWALSLRGNGDAILFEQHGLNWRKSDTFRYSNEARPRGGLLTLEILPYGKDAIMFRSHAIASDITEGGHYFAAGTYRRNPKDYLAHLYREPQANSGHTHIHAAAGAGNIRLDFRRDLRFECFVGLQIYPLQEDLYDQPFSIPIVPGGTVMRVRPTTETPTGTAVEMILIDATTHVPLNTNGDGNPLTNAGQRFYYPRVRFSSTDGRYAPLLRSYSVEVEGVHNFREPTPISADVLDLSLTGPDLEPNHETGSCSVDDPTGRLTILRKRQRVRCRVWTTTEYQDVDTGERASSVLFEGEVNHARGTEWARSDAEAWPVALGRHFGLTLMGMWARIWDQKLVYNEPMFDGNGPFKASAAIAGLFTKAGFPPQFQDFPASDIRLFPTSNSESITLKSGTPYAEAILYFARLYLNWLVVWDANAQKDPAEATEGLWRGLVYPQGPEWNILWNFTTEPPGAGKLVHLPESYPDRTSPVWWWQEWPQAPEFNHLVMQGAADGKEDGQKIEVEFINYASYQPNATDPAVDEDQVNCLPREVPQVVFMPELTTEEAVTYVGNRVFADGGFGKERIDFYAPLVLMWDDSDDYQIRPRPLRIGDMVRFNGRAAMILNCNPETRRHVGDLHQRGYYEAYFRESEVEAD